MDGINTKHIFQGVVATAGSFFTYLYGGWTATIQILLAFVIVDYVTGVISAIVNEGLSSRIGFKGIARKVYIFILVACGHLTDMALGTNTIIQDAVCYFFMANELLSILENAGEVGLPVPNILNTSALALKNKENASNKKIEQ